MISDIHGNQLALESVIRDIDQRGADRVVCLGDVVSNGFNPAGTLERLMSTGWTTVLGNSDEDIINPPDWYLDPIGHGAGDGAARIADIALWCRDQLSPKQLEELAGFPPSVTVSADRTPPVTLVHGSPNSNRDVITPETPKAELAEMLGDVPPGAVVGGHTHVPMLRYIDEHVLVNPGSVGQAFAGYGLAGEVPILPVAQYALLTVQPRAFSVEYREVPLEADDMREAALASGMPHADWWAGLWLG